MDTLKDSGVVNQKDESVLLSEAAVCNTEMLETTESQVDLLAAAIAMTNFDDNLPLMKDSSIEPKSVSSLWW